MENTENTQDTESNQDTNSATAVRSPRHKGRGAMWAVVLVGTVAALGSAAFMGHAVASGGFGKHHGGFGHRGEMLFKTFDTDQDGSITAAEIDAETQRRLKDHDANGDAALSLDEFQGVWIEMMRSRMVDAFQRFDEDGDGRVTKAEIDEKTNWMLTRMDRDEDGQITRKDMRMHFPHGDGDRRGDPKDN